MNVDDLTLREIKNLQDLLGGEKKEGLNCQIGEYVIIRTYAAGLWFGKLEQKFGSEVILSEARRLYYWKLEKGISASEIATYGLTDESKVCVPVKKQWLIAIEIISMETIAIESIKDKINYVV